MAPERPLQDLKVRDVMREKFVSVETTEPSSKVLAHFADRREPVVVVTDGKGRYQGLVSERDVLRSGVDMTKSPIERVLHGSPTMSGDESLPEAAARLLDANARGVAVLGDDGKVRGVLVREDVSLAAAGSELGERPVAEIMTRDLEVAPARDSVAKAYARMKRGGFSHLPITEGGKVTGIVTVHDLLRRVLAPLKGAMQEGWKTGPQERTLGVPVGGVMTSPVVRLSEAATYADIARAFHEENVGSVVITEDGAWPSGIVTRRDLLEPIALVGADVPLLVVQFSSKDASPDAYESSGSPEEVRSFLDRYQSRLEPGLLHIHLKKHKDRHRGIDQWLVRLNLTSQLGKFHAVGEGWGMAHATRLAVEHLEREVRREKEERLERPSPEYLADLLY